MIMNSEHYVLVYKGPTFDANLILALLKDSGVTSAVKIDNSVSSYTMLSTEDEVYVHEKEADQAYEVLKENPIKD